MTTNTNSGNNHRTITTTTTATLTIATTMVAYVNCKSIKYKIILFGEQKECCKWNIQCDRINHSRFNKGNITSISNKVVVMIDKSQTFIKLTIVNPSNMCQNITILESAVINHCIYQSHESHIVYFLQFVKNFNLYCMSFIYIHLPAFRQLLPKENGTKTNDKLKRLKTINGFHVSINHDKTRIERDFDKHVFVFKRNNDGDNDLTKRRPSSAYTNVKKQVNVNYKLMALRTVS